MTDEQLPAEDQLPGEIEAPEYDQDAYELTDEDAALPIVAPHDVPANNPGDVEGQEQDDLDDTELEGLGADDEPIWRRALPRIRDKVRESATNEVGFCLREIRIPNETASKYLDARGSMIAADWKVRLRTREDWDRVPRGSIGYYDGPNSPHGHIYENMGGGFVGTTDLPRGHWGRIHGFDLMNLWGYNRAFFADEVNDNQVGEWKRNGEIVRPEPTPKEIKLEQLRTWRGQLRDLYDEAVKRKDAKRIRTLRFRLRTINGVISRLAD